MSSTAMDRDETRRFLHEYLEKFLDAHGHWEIQSETAEIIDPCDPVCGERHLQRTGRTVLTLVWDEQ